MDNHYQKFFQSINKSDAFALPYFEELMITTCNCVETKHLVSAYQIVWAESLAYQEKFSYQEALNAIGALCDCWAVVMKKINQVVGFVGGYPMTLSTDPISLSLTDDVEHTYWIAELGLVPHHQGKGIGGFLLDYLVSQKKNAGMTEFLLCTAAKNNDATRLYEARGFEIILDTDGNLVTIPISQMRTDGVVRTDRRVFFRVKTTDYVYGRAFSGRGGG